MKKWTTKDLTLYGILMAMTTVATMLIQIPTIATKGYVNVGDAVVLLAGLVLGRRGGFVVGGFGSALADILLGYTWYAPITLLVKGVEGYLAGSIFSHTRDEYKHANVDTAKAVGERIAKRALEQGIETVVFDRSGYLYHGKVKELADSARAAGLKF